MIRGFLILIGITCFSLTLFGQFSLADSTHLILPNYSGASLGVADMNSDGFDDIIMFNATSNLTISYQQLDGSFEVDNIGNWGNIWGMCIGDVDQNGYNDIISGGAYNGIQVNTFNSNGHVNTTALPNPNIFLQGINLSDINNDSYLDVFACHDDGISSAYSNNGDGTFTYDLGLINAVSYTPSDNSGNYGSVWTDYDNDGDMDLYLSKCRSGVDNSLDARRVNLMYRNNGDGTFTEVAGDIGLRPFGQSWATDFADIDNDGDMDCIVLNHDIHNFIYENNGDGTFTEVTVSADPSGFISWFPGGIQINFDDYDNDGFVDLLLTGRAGQSNLLHNKGNFTFDLTTNLLYGGVHSAATGDLNNDGFLDMIIGHAIGYNSPSSNPDNLIINNTNNQNNWIKMVLKGNVSNINGIGARIEIYGDWGVQIREVRSGESYGIMNSLTKHFGLGVSTSIDNIIVRWPSGNVDSWENPPINVQLPLEEGCGGNIYNIDANICAGEVYYVSDNTYDDDGQYFLIDENIGQCDSIIYLSLHIFENYNIIIDTTICLGATLVINGDPLVITESFQLSLELSTTFGCDSIVNYNVDLYENYSSIIDTTVCIGSTLIIDGSEVVITNEIHTEINLSSIDGCDSTILVGISLFPTYTSSDVIYVCHGDSFTFGDGMTFSNIIAPFNYIDGLTSIDGCDSLISYSVLVNLPNNIYATHHVCIGDSFVFNDGTSSDVISENITHNSLFTNSSGCDSIIHTNLVVDIINTTFEVYGDTLIAVDGFTYQWINCSTNEDIDGATNSIFIPNDSGNYAVNVSLGQCMEISECINVTVGIRDILNDAISIFPNPVSEKFFIHFEDYMGITKISILDINGIIVLQSIEVDNDSSIDVSQLTNGLYFINIQIGEESIIKKFIKE